MNYWWIKGGFCCKEMGPESKQAVLSTLLWPHFLHAAISWRPTRVHTQPAPRWPLPASEVVRTRQLWSVTTDVPTSQPVLGMRCVGHMESGPYPALCLQQSGYVGYEKASPLTIHYESPPNAESCNKRVNCGAARCSAKWSHSPRQNVCAGWEQHRLCMYSSIVSQLDAPNVSWWLWNICSCLCRTPVPSLSKPLFLFLFAPHTRKGRPKLSIVKRQFVEEEIFFFFLHIQEIVDWFNPEQCAAVKPPGSS